MSGLARLLIVVLVAMLHVPMFVKGFPYYTVAVPVFIIACFTKNPAVFSLSLFWALYYTMGMVLPSILKGYPTYEFVIIFVSFAAIALTKNWRGVQSWLQRGEFNKWVALQVFGVSIVSGGALILWGLWTDNLGIGAQMAQNLQGLSSPLILLVIIPIFALQNAFREEVIYRGFFQQAATDTAMGPYWTIFLQSLAFAAVHYVAGFPNGIMGYAMTFIYAVALGTLRYRCKGMLAPYLTHVMADLVIGYFLVFTFVI